MHTKTFSALADPTRRAILERLKKKASNVTEITGEFNVAMPTISHHLQVLREANLVSSRRVGQQIVYSLNLSVFEEVAKELIKIFTHK